MNYEQRKWMHTEDMKGELIEHVVAEVVRHWTDGLISTGELLNKLIDAHTYWYEYSRK